MGEEESERPPKIGGGPRGLGDPNDVSLRKVELDVLIPKRMREIAKVEKCAPEVASFTECCKNSSLGMIFFCRKENEAMKECLGRWYANEEFKNRCKNEYLEERKQYRLTGVSKKKREYIEELRRGS